MTAEKRKARPVTAADNRYLRVNRSVVLTPIIEPVIIALDPFFKQEGKVAYITSGLRTPESQLSIIRGYLAKTGLDKDYKTAMSCDLYSKTATNDKLIYTWQLGWSALLNRGIIINPPIPAECLMDYYRGGVNKKGQTIGASPHFAGTAFDIGGGTDGIDGNVVSELKILQAAIKNGVSGIRGYLPERNNNCVHVDCINNLNPKP
jgi:hypothetical protein